MAADMAAVIEAVRAAIEDAAMAPRPTEPPYTPFEQAYGPGLQGINEYVEEGLFFIYANRYGHMNIHETGIVVNIIPDNDSFNPPYQRNQLDNTTQEILAAVEAEFLTAGATLHYEGRDNNQEKAPWRWYMTWVWDRRD